MQRAVPWKPIALLTTTLTILLALLLLPACCCLRKGMPPLNHLPSVPQGKPLVQSGIMHQVVDIPSTMYGDLSLTPDGRIRIHPAKLDICGINGLGLLKAVGQTMEKMLDLSKAKGIQAEKDDLLLEPLKILPPPQIEGRLAEVQMEGGELEQAFEAGLHFLDLQLAQHVA